MFGVSSVLTLALATFTIASPSHVDRRSFEVRNGVNHTIFEHGATGSTLSFVTNSGVCETTPGVNQYSGYLSVGTNMSMFFWFFEARNSPCTAPLALWLNGGPGCSSMIGLFQENGPCTFNNVSGPDPVLNPYSWNNYANMLYVDQPIGAGFSFGIDNVTSTSEGAAPYAWILLQAFYAQFPSYKNRNFGLFTESYGGHYGPEFASYFETQNAGIDQGTVYGEKISLVALGINNGWIDPNNQFKSLIDYAASNPYHVVINSSQAAAYYNSYDESCGPALNNCSSSDSNDACANAAVTCINNIMGPIPENFDPYDVTQPANYSFPPVTYNSYLQNSNIQARIGAQVLFQNCSDDVYDNFVYSGDFARSFLPTLSKVVQSDIAVLIWVGDLDWICNAAGVQTVISQIQFEQSTQFNSESLAPYTVDGVQYGTFKTAGNLSFLKVFEAGHEIPAFQPVVALQAFIQTMSQQPLSST